MVDIATISIDLSRLVSGFANRVEHELLSLAVNCHVSRADIDTVHARAFDLFQRLSNACDASLTVHSLDREPHLSMLDARRQ
jgi:hypothetical protein